MKSKKKAAMMTRYADMFKCTFFSNKNTQKNPKNKIITLLFKFATAKMTYRYTQIQFSYFYPSNFFNQLTGIHK